jgi:NAD(P)-dependent dehydrogenase (short-subunit alcohol dehydrogenase family)
MDGPFSGRVALITGASGGIGQALARRLATGGAVGLVGLGVPLAAAGKGGIGRLGQMRRDAGRGQFLRDIPPPGAPLDRERDVLAAGEPRQSGPQMRPVRRGDLAALHLPGLGVEVVEGDLLPVDIQPAYDGHRDLLKLRRAHARPPCELPTRSILTRV